MIGSFPNWLYLLTFNIVYSSQEPQQWATGPQCHTALIIYCACLSGHWVATAVFVLLLRTEFQRMTHENPKYKTFPTLSIVGLQAPFKFKTRVDFLADFGFPLQMIFWKLMKKITVGAGTLLGERKSLGIKQTQVEPNANRGCPIKVVNHI